MYLHYIISISLCVFPVSKVNGMDDRIITGLCSKHEMVRELFMDVVKRKRGGYSIHIPMNCNTGNEFAGIWIRKNLQKGSNGLLKKMGE